MQPVASFRFLVLRTIIIPLCGKLQSFTVAVAADMQPVVFRFSVLRTTIFPLCVKPQSVTVAVPVVTQRDVLFSDFLSFERRIMSLEKDSHCVETYHHSG